MWVGWLFWSCFIQAYGVWWKSIQTVFISLVPYITLWWDFFWACLEIFMHAECFGHASVSCYPRVQNFACVSNFAQNWTGSEPKLMKWLKLPLKRMPWPIHTFFNWFYCFKNGCTSVASDKHSAYPPSSRNDEVLAEVSNTFYCSNWCTLI